MLPEPAVIDEDLLPEKPYTGMQSSELSDDQLLQAAGQSGPAVLHTPEQKYRVDLIEEG